MRANRVHAPSALLGMAARASWRRGNPIGTVRSMASLATAFNAVMRAFCFCFVTRSASLGRCDELCPVPVVTLCARVVAPGKCRALVSVTGRASFATAVCVVRVAVTRAAVRVFDQSLALLLVTARARGRTLECERVRRVTCFTRRFALVGALVVSRDKRVAARAVFGALGVAFGASMSIVTCQTALGRGAASVTDCDVRMASHAAARAHAPRRMRRVAAVALSVRGGPIGSQMIAVTIDALRGARRLEVVGLMTIRASVVTSE